MAHNIVYTGPIFQLKYLDPHLNDVVCNSDEGDKISEISNVAKVNLVVHSLGSLNNYCYSMKCSASSNCNSTQISGLFFLCVIFKKI